MKSRLAIIFLASVVLFAGWKAGAAGSDESPTPSGIGLHRFIQNSDPLPGETVEIRFELTNDELVEVDYTLIEEVPVHVTVLETGDGNYNRTAGFIVWRGTLAPKERLTVPYVIQVESGAQGVLPLYAYMTTSRRDVLEQSDQLHVRQLDWQLALGNTLVHKGDDATVRLRVRNPFDRTLPVEFTYELAEELQFEHELPTSIFLAAGDEWTFETVVTAGSVGRHVIRVSPLIGGIVTTSPGQVTLTLYDGERPRTAAETEAVDSDVAQRQPVTTERVHDVRLPVHLLHEGEELVLVARMPGGAGYVPGSARMGDDESVTPRVSGEHLLFPVPLQEHVMLRYHLAYEDRSMLTEHVPDDYNDVGIISMGATPRVLFGDEQLLYALHGERRFEPRPRVGAVILNPFDGQIFTEREQIDVEVDGPTGSQLTLRLNGIVVSRDQIGAVAEETDRFAEKYIAVPLTIGANELELTALTADGDVLSDTIIVYRSGPVTNMTITPLSDMVTGGVHPLLVQVVVTDENGLAPADGMPMTVEVSGGKLLTPDERPDWVGHQVLLYDGRALLQIESPTEAGLISISARMGEVTEGTTLAVTARADDWFLLGLGTVRTEGWLSPQGTKPTTSTDLRLVARGPVRSGVLTAAIDTRANSSIHDPTALWAGDTSSRGIFVGSGEPVHLKLERGLSYVRYGSGRVEFAGELARYNRTHTGIQSVVQETPGFSLHSFVDSEPAGRLQELIDGDGTGYYRLAHGAIERNSEDVAIIAREPFFPYKVVRERGLTRSEYTVDYLTGQIWLREPLLGRDADGNLLSLRVRYNTVGEPVRLGVGGLQATWHLENGHIRATARLARDDNGEAVQLFTVGGRTVGARSLALDWEAAVARDDLSTAAAYVVGLTHPSVFGWNVRIGHRYIHPDVASVVDGLQSGIVTSLAGERRVGAVRWTARASLNQEHDGAPWISESELEADWSWGKLRPSLGVKVRHGLVTPFAAAMSAGVGFNIANGSIAVSREFPIIGEHPVHDVVEGRVNVARGLDLLFAVDRETDGAGVSESRSAISVTKSLGSSANTVLRGGYEYSDVHGPAGAMVYSASSLLPINDAHSLQFVVDHRRPLGDTALPSYGGQFGWTYKHDEGESTFRFDHRTDGSSVKQSLQWRGFQPVADGWALQVDALVFRDDYVHTGTRISLGAAYRTELSALLASATTERNSGPLGGKQSSEWRVKAAHNLSPSVLVNVGYARRVTDAPTVTDKIGLSFIVRMSETYQLVFEGSHLRQHESGTSLLGGRLGVGYRLTDDWSLTFGYAASDYVGFDSAGSGFARRRSGAFIELNLLLDESNIAGWFERRED